MFAIQRENPDTNKTHTLFVKRAMWYPLLNTITFLATVFVNYYASTGKLTGESVGELSDRYHTLITPAGYAFSIWGLIYLMLTGLLVHQWWELFNRKKLKASSLREPHFVQFGSWFALSNVFNILWILAWTNELIGLSVLIMFALLSCIIAMVVRTKMELWQAPFRVILWVWWPIAIYFGWVILASVVNVSALLTYLRWDGAFWSPEQWTIVMMSLATLIYVLLILLRNLRESAAVGIWGFLAIAVGQNSANSDVYFWAIGLSIVLGISISIHAFVNRKTLPFIGKHRPQ